MAVGSNVYSSRKLIAEKDKVRYNILYAKELKEYQSLVNIKSIFFLDYLFRQKVEGEDVFIGGVEYNSDNYYLRKPSRASKLRVSVPVSDTVRKNYILLNDAGLNTMAYIMVSVQSQRPYANYTKFYFYVKSAYYSTTTKFGFRYRVDGGYWYSYAHPEAPVRAGGIYNSVDVVQGIAYQRGQRVEIQPYTENEEGERTFSIFSYVTDEYIHFQSATKIDSLSDNPNDNPATNFFLTSSSLKNLGRVTQIAGVYDVMVYSDPDMTVPIEDGLYHITYSPIEGETYRDDQLGAYTGNKAVVEAVRGRIQRWLEGYWIIPTPPADIYIGVTAEIQNAELESSYFKYIISLTNNMTNSTGNMLVEVWTYRMLSISEGSPELVPNTKLAQEVISAGPKESRLFISALTFYAGSDDAAVGIRASLGSNVSIAGPALIPGKGPTPGQ